MDKLSVQVEAICLVSMLSGILCAVIPQGRMKSAFSCFCAVVLIFFILEPVTHLRGDGVGELLQRDARTQQELMNDVSAAESQLCERVIAQAIEKKLKQAGLNFSVRASCEGDEESIRVRKLILSASVSDEEKARARELLSQTFPEAEIEFQEEKDE